MVYAKYVRPPRDALVLEVLGQQWQWRYRFPGADGKLGGTDARFVSATNPFGLDPDDPAGQDNILVNGNEVHLPLGRPVRVVLRSHDVLHDFYVPQFRARMNMVPGMVSRFWFTPTRRQALRSDVRAAMRRRPPNMRGFVVVEDEPRVPGLAGGAADFRQDPGQAAAAGRRRRRSRAGEQGRALAQSKGCTACHTVDGSAGVGPTLERPVRQDGDHGGRRHRPGRRGLPARLHPRSAAARSSRASRRSCRRSS